jgi:hypothetical protein
MTSFTPARPRAFRVRRFHEITIPQLQQRAAHRENDKRERQEGAIVMINIENDQRRQKICAARKSQATWRVQPVSMQYLRNHPHSHRLTAEMAVDIAERFNAHLILDDPADK